MDRLVTTSVHESGSSRMWLPSDFWVALVLTCVSLPLYGWLMTLWKVHGTFAQYNILFDTDPNQRLSVLANGWGGDGFVHPILPVLFSLPFHMISAVLTRVGLVGDAAAFRVQMALWIAPTMSAMKVGLSYWGGRMLGASRVGALAIALLMGCSTSALVFCAIPEHHPLSAAALAALFVWAIAVQFNVVRDRNVVWGALVFLAGGLTITNLLPALAVFFVMRTAREGSWRKACAATAILGVICGGLAIGVSVAGSSLIRNSEDAVERTTEFTGSYLRRPDLERSVRYLVALANSVSGGKPAVTPNTLPPDGEPDEGHFLNIQFSYDALPASAGAWRTVLTLAVIFLGLVYGWRREVRFRPIAIAALLVLLFNGVLHSVWGAEWLLYSMHWQAALAMLAAGWTVRSSRFGGGLLMAFAVVVAIHSVMVIRGMLMVLAAG